MRLLRLKNKNKTADRKVLPRRYLVKNKCMQIPKGLAEKCIKACLKELLQY